MPLPVLSFFTGGGFLDMGFEKAGFNLVWTNEIIKDFKKCYDYGYSAWLASSGIERRNTKIVSMDDIRNLKPDNILSQAFHNKKPGYFGIIGGPPCTDFSQGGKNGGYKGKYGQLTGTYISLVCHIRPVFMLMENVPGLYKIKKHRVFFENIIRTMKRNGYGVSYKLLNAVDFGVPQDRERIFLLAIDKSIIRTDENISDFLWPQGAFQNAKKKYNWPTVNKYGSNIPAPKDIPLELTVYPLLKDEDILCKIPNGNEYFVAHSPKFWEIAEGDVSGKSFKRLHRYRYSPTVWYGNNEVHLHPWLPRRLSVREAMRIQSIPDDYILPADVSLTAKFKLIANGVPAKLAYEVAKSIKSYILKKLP